MNHDDTREDLEIALEPESSGPEYLNIDRPRAMLTKTDRELLVGQKDYDSAQPLRNARHRVREHIRQSLNDVYLINSQLESSELKQIVERQTQLDIDKDRTHIWLPSGLVQLGVRMEYAASENPEMSDEELIEGLLKESLRTVLKQIYDDVIITGVDLSVNIKKQDPESEQFVNNLISGKPAVEEVVGYLSSGDAEYLRRRLRELDAEIEMSNGQSIGPDDRFFEVFAPESQG
jgi:hypothetical protein